MNKNCFLLWKQLSRRDRPPGQGEIRPVPSKAIGDICEIYGLSIQDFERIGLIEDYLYDWMAERYSNQVAGEMENVRSTDSSRNKTGPKTAKRFTRKVH
ncbi:MAG: hypothetical protein KAS39_02425 [Actinomycetia bacterium]|nr:hypothetical protein [Actinomycetes bacterium]